MTRYRDRISKMIGETAQVFGERTAKPPHAMLQAGDDLQDEYDELIDEQLHTEKPAREAVPRALLYRYCKRITAHLMNILTMLQTVLIALNVHRPDQTETKPGSPRRRSYR
ncbi:MAG: hypothetical protein ACXW15_08005 [Acidimicrobiia bacterium]